MFTCDGMLLHVHWQIVTSNLKEFFAFIMSVLLYQSTRPNILEELNIQQHDY